MAESHIEWTDSTWNPVTGCTKISAGCKNCYALRMTKRLQGMGLKNYRNGFTLTTHDYMLDLPLHWKKPQRIFVNSMSDLFHPDVPNDFIQRVFRTMRDAHWHQFQVLTKRPARVVELNSQILWPENVWMGTSVENAKVRHRIHDLRKTSASVKFLSLEPLIGPLENLDLRGIHWVIVGGESGPNARPMQERWVRSIKAQCEAASIPFFFKQWGGVFKARAGRQLDGKTWDEYPAPRQFGLERPLAIGE